MDWALRRRNAEEESRLLSTKDLCRHRTVGSNPNRKWRSANLTRRNSKVIALFHVCVASVCFAFVSFLVSRQTPCTVSGPFPSSIALAAASDVSGCSGSLIPESRLISKSSLLSADRHSGDLLRQKFCADAESFFASTLCRFARADLA